MKNQFKKIICTIAAAALILPVASSIPSKTAIAKESIGNGLILSSDVITVTESAPASFTAVMPEGFDASRLTCVVADDSIATVSPIAYAQNAAAFGVGYVGTGTTVAAIVSIDNPAVVAYVTINSSSVIMDIPSKLGTNHSNYCKLVDYTFEPYDATYSNFNNYKYTLNIRYQCTSYNDDGYNKWGCYGYFYDASGNLLSKVHLYCSSLSKGRIYSSEFNVPVNAVRFSIEGF